MATETPPAAGKPGTDADERSISNDERSGPSDERSDSESESTSDTNDSTTSDPAAPLPHQAFEAYAEEPVPQAAPGSPGKTGRLELGFEQSSDGETRLVRDFAQAPFHVSGTLDHDPIEGAATVYVQSPSGGIAQGDRRTTTVTVGPDATARVGTGSATKVFSMDANYASADVSLSVESGGHLAYVREPAILHPDARFCQSVSLEVATDASAILGDVVVPGRLARGESFDFERYYSQTEIVGPDGLLAADATHLRPKDQRPQAPGILGDHAVLGTLFVVAPALDTAGLSDAVHAAVSGDERTDPDAPCGTAGATALPNGAGVLVRALGATTPPVRRSLRTAWSVARRRLFGEPIPDRRT